MMSALDGASPPSVTSVHSVPVNTAVASTLKLRQPPHNKKENTQPRKKKDVIDSADLSTDTSVTSVPSEDQSPSPSPPVMVVSNNRSEGERVLVRNGLSVRGALVELQQLRGKLLHFTTSADAAAPVGKENQPPSVTCGRPFEALIDSLRRMNPELAAGQGRSVPGSSPAAPTQFRLLQLPLPRQHDFPVKFPSVVSAAPRFAWESVDRIPPAEEFFRQMPAVGERTRHKDEYHKMSSSFKDDFPLLHFSNNNFCSGTHDAAFSDGLPFPMLQLVDPRRGQVPFFVPPEEIVGRNNNSREMSVAARSEPPTGIPPVSSQRSVQLLKLQPCLPEASDVMETDSRQVLNRPLYIVCETFVQS